MERRDQYFTRLQSRIEVLHTHAHEKVLHSPPLDLGLSHTDHTSFEWVFLCAILGVLS